MAYRLFILSSFTAPIPTTELGRAVPPASVGMATNEMQFDCKIDADRAYDQLLVSNGNGFKVRPVKLYKD